MELFLKAIHEAVALTTSLLVARHDGNKAITMRDLVARMCVVVAGYRIVS